MARDYVELGNLEDDSLMPSGKHKGTKMKDVPDNYLLYIYENDMVGERVATYIEKNLDSIKANVKRLKDKKED